MVNTKVKKCTYPEAIFLSCAVMDGEKETRTERDANETARRACELGSVVMTRIVSWPC